MQTYLNIFYSFQLNLFWGLNIKYYWKAKILDNKQNDLMICLNQIAIDFIFLWQNGKETQNLQSSYNNITKNQIMMENQTLSECQQIINRLPSKTDTIDTTTPQWIFQKYRCGLITQDAPFQLFYINDQLSMNDQSSEETKKSTKFRGPYRKYTFEEKMIAVQRIQKGQDVKQISKQFGIPRRNILRWKKNGCERKEGGGRPTDQEMEQFLYTKIKNRLVTGQKQIRNQAIFVSKSSSFKASKGWFLKFCRRFQLTITGQLIQKSQ